ncbi:DUF2325 domain-containing protein [Dechloromonas sp. ZY10]|uniref:DUF2325 domain-containing protein n=1 Tax=Dechloromonas aquae TaxID=2664436 RepID=UPI00352818E5
MPLSKKNEPGFPFHVAGGILGGSRKTFVAGLGAEMDEAPLAPPPLLRASGSRRRKLWEIPHKFHCPVIGVCFGCDELRSLMAKVMHFPRDTSDFTLHTTAVGACEERTRLAELLHKTLEKRYQLTLKQFAALKTNHELQTAWQRSLSDGSQVPAVLWALWTHPACDARLEQEVYGDIHMLQHQLGSGTRADLRAMQALQGEHAELRRQLQQLQVAAEQLRQEQAMQQQGLRQQLGEVQAEAAARESWGLGLQRELAALHAELPDLKERRELAQQLDFAREQLAQLRARNDEQAAELARLRDYASFAEESLAALSRHEEMPVPALPPADLGGKCVLCVGGRSGAVHSYREVVEQSGGRFMHHDGGLEESLHRIDSALAAADIVICQAGCISHNAYWRVKDLCKRSGKPCMFVKSGGVSSFGKVVDAAGRVGQEA